MSKEVQFTGNLTDDFTQINIEHAQKLRRLLLPFGGDLLEVTVKKFYKNRTNRQNRYVWGVLVPYVREFVKENTGSAPSKEAIYAFLRIKIVGQEVVIEEVDGFDIPVIVGKRFSHMNTVEFAEAVDKIIAYYADQGLEIPVPQDENLPENFMRYDKT